MFFTNSFFAVLLSVAVLGGVQQGLGLGLARTPTFKGPALQRQKKFYTHFSKWISDRDIYAIRKSAAVVRKTERPTLLRNCFRVTTCVDPDCVMLILSPLSFEKPLTEHHGSRPVSFVGCFGHRKRTTENIRFQWCHLRFCWAKMSQERPVM